MAAALALSFTARSSTCSVAHPLREPLRTRPAPDAQLLAAFRVPNDVTFAILRGPGAICAGHVLARNEHLCSMVFVADDAAILQLLPDVIVELPPALIVGSNNECAARAVGVVSGDRFESLFPIRNLVNAPFDR